MSKKPVRKSSAATRSKAKPMSATPLTDRQKASGDWNPLWDEFHKLDPEFLEAYIAFRSVPHQKGPLPQKVKEFIMIAINAATTHMYGPGVRRHMQNAIKAGATREELLEVIQLTTVMGMHAFNLAVPILLEETGAKKGARKK
jgi:alkylhydroperoxidase/carboxymuconolactone decarboxylase family protein YurZ